MAIYIPQRIFDYKINTSSRTEELITLRRLLSEVGGYASTMLRRDYLSLAKKCSALLRRIERELDRRDTYDTLAEAVTLPGGDIFYKDLSSLTVSQLELLFRMHPQRVRARLADGREHLTRYFESRIVAELRRRKAADSSEQMKIDYCLITHRAEMENLANILAPVSLEEHERMVEFVDEAIDRLDSATSLQPFAGLAAQLVELNRKKIVRSPERIAGYLNEAIRQWLRNPEVEDTEIVEPLLVAAYLANDWSLERRAQRIIRRCYRRCLAFLKENHLADSTLKRNLEIAESFNAYIDRYSPRKMEACRRLFTPVGVPVASN